MYARFTSVRSMGSHALEVQILKKLIHLTPYTPGLIDLLHLIQL
jgi:hypothetical protein